MKALLQRPWVQRLAWGSVFLSFPVWFGAFVVPPFLPLSVAEEAAAAATMIGVGEALFWLPTLILGAQVVNRFRKPKVRTGASLHGLRVAVMGASGGLGAAVVRALHREGAAVVLMGPNEAALRTLAAEVGGTVVLTDLHPDNLRQAAAAIGALDHLVCATGQDLRKPLLSHEDAEVAQQLSISLQGPIDLVRCFVPTLRPGGTVVLCGGIGDGRLPLPYCTVDVAARAGLASFCAAMNRELALEGRDLRLCTFCPTPEDTEAERPFAALWAEMGSPPMAPEAVADGVLQSLLARRAVTVMGLRHQATVYLEQLAAPLADLRVQRWLGPRLKAAFGDQTRPRTEERDAT